MIIMVRTFVSSKFFRYLVSGGTTAIVDLVVLYGLVHWAGMWYLSAAIIAFVGAFVVSFTLQKFFTFRDQSNNRTIWQLAVYLSVAIVNLAINSALMYVLVSILGQQYLIAQIIVFCIVSFYSFFIYQKLIFRVSASAGTIE